MSAVKVPYNDTSPGGTLGGDGNSNLFSPLTLISLAARLNSASPTLPSLPSSLSRVSDRKRGQELSMNDLHRAYRGDVGHQQQLPKGGLFEAGSTWAGLETPDTVSALNDDIEGGMIMGPPNDSMFPTLSPRPVTTEKKERQYQVLPKHQSQLEEKPGSLSGMLPSVFRDVPHDGQPKKRIKPVSVKPKPLTTVSAVAPSCVPVAAAVALDMSTNKRRIASKRKWGTPPKQIWEYPKWPLLPLDTIDMEEKRMSELRRNSLNPNSQQHHPRRGFATGDRKLSMLFLPADESSMQVMRDVGLSSRLALHVPWRKRLKQVVALLREKWMAIPHPRLNRLRLLVPCPSSEKDKEVVVDDGIQEQPRFLSCLGMNKMECTMSELFHEFEPHGDAVTRVVPDQTNNGDGPDFIVLYVLGTANIDEIGVIENEKDEILPFPTDRTLPAQCYRIPSIHSYHRKTMTTKETLGAAASSSIQRDLEHQYQCQSLPLPAVNTTTFAGNSSSSFPNEPSNPVCGTTKQQHHTTTNQISFALGEDTCASLFSWNVH